MPLKISHCAYSVRVALNRVSQQEICILCGRISSQRFLITDTPFRIAICRSCDLGHTEPRPTRDELRSLYDRETGTTPLGVRDFYSDSGFVLRIKDRLAKRDARKRIQNIYASRSILDFGCGNGLFSNALASVAPNAKVTASDFFSDRPNDLDPKVDYLPIGDLKLSDVDLIVLRHVLEHLDDPSDTLRRCAAMLSESGQIYIEVPNARCAMAALLGSKWVHWYVPRHLQHFSKTSLEACLKQAGLSGKIQYCDLPSVGVQLASLLGARSYSISWKLIGIGLQPVSLLIEKLFAISSLWGLTTGGGNAIWVCARKSDS